MKLMLSKPIQVGGKPVSELELREPRGGDIRKCGAGSKTEVSDSGARLHVPDMEVFARYISELAGIPPSSVDTMYPADFMKAVGIINDFFEVANSESSSTGAGNSPGSSTE